MNLKHLFIAGPAALIMLGAGAAKAGQTIDDSGPWPASMTSGTRRSLRRATSWSTMRADA